MDNVTPQDTSTPRRTLFAAGRWPQRDAMWRRSDAIEDHAVPRGAQFELAELYRTASRMARMTEAQQISYDTAMLFVAAACARFETAMDGRLTARDVADVDAMQARVRAWNTALYAAPAKAEDAA